MLIAVTGATGFIGRYIVRELVGQGHTCRCWCRQESSRGGWVDQPGVVWVPGRLDDDAATRDLVDGVDAVVHAALDHHEGWGPGHGGELLGFVQANVVGSLRLMQAATQRGVGKFVYLSSCAVHDVILDDRPLDETHPLWARSHYGAHKAAVEKFVHSFGLGGVAGDGWDVCSLRPTGVYGLAEPVQASRWYRLVSDVVEGKPIQTRAGGKEVHASDVAKAVGLLLGAGPAPGVVAGQAYNCYDLYVAQEEVARIAKDCSGSPSRIESINQGPKHQIDTSKLRDLGMSFGGRALLERTVRELVEAVRAGR